MQVKLKISDLKPALLLLGKAVNDRSFIPVLKNIYCKATSGELIMATTDLDNTIKYKMALEEDIEFETVIPFRFLEQIVGLSIGDEIVIEIEERFVKFNVGLDQYSTSIDNFKDFPKLPEFSGTEEVALPAGIYEKLMKATPMVIKDNLRPSMTKVCMDFKNGQLRIVSTNAHIMYRGSYQVSSELSMQILLSASTIKALSNLSEVKMEVGENHIRFHDGVSEVLAKVTHDKYPNWEAVVPDYPANCRCLKGDLESVIKKVQVVKSDTEIAVFYLKPGGVVDVKSEGINNSVTTQEDMVFDGEEMVVSMDARLLQVLLNSVEGSDINLHIKAPNRPILITSNSDESFTGLLMPIATASV